MLEVNQLRKTFGKTVAVDNISFAIPDGTIMGLIGQNGSGKTTLFRLILDFLTPEGDGQVLWNHEPLDASMQNNIGYLPEERGLYEDITVEDQIVLFGELRGCPKKIILERIDEWMDRFGVKGDRKDKISSLSKGNQQKIQVIATLIHEPQLIILDEPFSGLDPINGDLLKDGVRMLRDKGACIIFSDHNMANVEELCDTVFMIHNGQETLSGPVEAVRNQFGRTRIFIESETWSKQDLESLEQVTEVQQLKNHHYKLILTDEQYGPEIFDQITQGHYIPTFSQVPPSLEEIFKMKAGEHHA